MSLPRSLRVVCTAPAKGRFSPRTRQLLEDRRAVDCEVATRRTVSAISTLLSTCVGRLRHLDQVQFPFSVCASLRALEFNREAKKGILGRAAERRDGPQVYDVGLVPPRETLEQAGLATRGNPATPVVHEPVRACSVRLGRLLCRLRRVLDS
jgi:hypothetical protein